MEKIASKAQKHTFKRRRFENVPETCCDLISKNKETSQTKNVDTKYYIATQKGCKIFTGEHFNFF